jgi:hypothetical protein
MERYLPIKHPWVNSSEAPIYQVTFPTQASDDKLLSYCGAVEAWSQQVAYPVFWLMDLSHVGLVSAQQRALFANYMRGMRTFDERCTKGSALILPNALLRGVATAIFWLYVPPFLHRTFAECNEGLAWLREQMGEIPAEARGAAREPNLDASLATMGRPSAASAGVAEDASGPRDRASLRPNRS